MPVDYAKDKALRLLVDFLDYPHQWGCTITCKDTKAHMKLFGLVNRARKAFDAVVVGETCMHRTLGMVNVRAIEGKIARVIDFDLKEHHVRLGECKRIVKG